LGLRDHCGGYHWKRKMRLLLLGEVFVSEGLNYIDVGCIGGSP